MIREWFVVKRDSGDQLPDGTHKYWFQLATRQENEPEYFHVDGWVSKTLWDAETMEVVKVYGTFEKDSRFEEDVEKLFFKEFRIPVAYKLEELHPSVLIAPEGWVDTEGNFYPVEYGGHSDKAYELIRHLGMDDPYREAMNILYSANWYSIHSGTVCCDVNRTFTTAQKNMALKLEFKASHRAWLANFKYSKRKIGLSDDT